LTCCFSNRNESIQHLFFYCYIAKNIWRIIYFALKIEMPININHIIGSWTSNRDMGYKKLLLTEISTLFWSIWLTRNEVALITNQYHQLCISFLEILTSSGTWRLYRIRKHINKLSMCAKPWKRWRWKSLRIMDDDQMQDLSVASVIHCHAICFR
jgi:hypothetical protein